MRISQANWIETFKRSVIILGAAISLGTAASESNSLIIKKIKYNNEDNKGFRVIAADGAAERTFIYWYDCPYNQCMGNTSEKAHFIMAILLSAQASGQSVKIIYETWNSAYYFNAVEIASGN
jgi:hypothetical protein